jgi:hypothetical protein
MTLVQRQQLFSYMLADQFGWMKGQGLLWTLGDAWRSTDELLCPYCAAGVTYQELLKANGRSKVRVSTHNERCAIDLMLWVDGRLSNQGEHYRSAGEHWEALGGRWGGRFGIDPADYAEKVGWDPGHFELP